MLSVGSICRFLFTRNRQHLVTVAGAGAPPAGADPLLALPAAVAALQVQMNALQAALQGLPAAVAALQGLPAAVAAIQHQASVSSAHNFNASAMIGTQALRMPPNAGGILPAAAGIWFPVTLSDLVPTVLSHPRANALLAHYGLQAILGANGAAYALKRAALAAHLGVRV